MKICTIGPTYPYKGGISHFNTTLCNNLIKQHEVFAISFKRLYSRLLVKFFYKMDIDFKDKMSKEKIEFEAKEIIDSVNPFTWLKAFFYIEKQKADLLIFHWQTTYFSFVYFTIMFFVKLFTKTKVLLLCHNLLPHEPRKIDKFLTKLVFSKADYFLVHSEKDAISLNNLVFESNVKVGFHPLYDIFKKANLDIKKEKTKLGLGKRIILFFGYIRPYKGLLNLIKAVEIVLKKIDITLLVVGEFWGEKEEYIEEINKRNLNNQIVIIDKYVPNEDVANYFEISDVLILPYLSGTQSGVLQIAFALNKPVICTDVGGFSEVVTNNYTGFVVDKSPEELAEAIINFYEGGYDKKFVENIKKDKNRFSWNNYIKIIESFF